MLVAVKDSPKHKQSTALIRDLLLPQPVHIAAVYHHEQPQRFPAWVYKMHPNQAIKSGEWGCALAHIDCWNWIVRSDMPALIFEDDIAISAPRDVVKRHIDVTIANNAEKDVVFIGYSCQFMCTHAYYVTPAGARKLLHGVDPVHHVVPTPIDHHIRRLCVANTLTFAHAPNLRNSANTEFDGVVKQVRSRDARGRIRFKDVSRKPAPRPATT